MKLKGKTALITGAARGIGRGIAELFAEEGADVAINDISLDGSIVEWIRMQGRRAIGVKADVSNRAQVEAMFEQVSAELGPIDILVNNAGIETIVPFLELTDEQWTRVTRCQSARSLAMFASILQTRCRGKALGKHRKYRIGSGG